MDSIYNRIYIYIYSCIYFKTYWISLSWWYSYTTDITVVKQHTQTSLGWIYWCTGANEWKAELWNKHNGSLTGIYNPNDQLCVHLQWYAILGYDTLGY